MLDTVSEVQKILFWVFLGLFIAVSLVHLFASFIENKRLRRITKPFCILFLGLACLAIKPLAWPIYVGAFMGALGDIILIKKAKKHLILGCSAFFLGHLCYIGYMLDALYIKGVMPWWGFLVALACYIVTFILCIKPMRHVTSGNKRLGYGVAIYFSALIALLGVSSAVATLGLGPLLGLCIAGSVLFISSDTVLVFTIFRHDIKRKDFYIMLTYLAAEASILLSLTFTVL